MMEIVLKLKQLSNTIKTLSDFDLEVWIAIQIILLLLLPVILL
jgi:hypothetical protein